MIKTSFLAFLLSLILGACVNQKSASSDSEWIQLFNGKDLKDWNIKIRGYELNDNAYNTFQVQDGYLTVDYSEYDDFKQQYGHIFYKDNFSYYKILTEYRFIGEQAPKGEGWAFRNSGIMVHGQPAETMGLGQDFPISIEVQLLGGKSDGKERPTCNLCTPGTHVNFEGKFDKRHCINSTSKTYDGDQWVTAEVEVYGDSLIRHKINGETVLEYTKPVVGGGVVSGFPEGIKIDGKSLTSGSISLQSESHPVQFRKVALLNLEGCTDPKAKNFNSHYVRNDGSCIYK